MLKIVGAICLFTVIWSDLREPVLAPVRTNDRRDAYRLELSPIGEFGLTRKGRKNIPSHLHTGIDIKRPNANYDAEPIFPIMDGVVISKRDDGPYAQLIIEHEYKGGHFWTLYEHISGIEVHVRSTVSPERPIARFMSREELNKYGWQFDHVHFEVLRMTPVRLAPTAANPERFFASYSLSCHSMGELEQYFFDPLEFLRNTRQHFIQ